MIELRAVLIDKDNTSKESAPIALMKESAENKVIELINGNAGRRSFMDLSNPEMLSLNYCDDPNGAINRYLFSGSSEEIAKLRIFALHYKVQKKREENLSKN